MLSFQIRKIVPVLLFNLKELQFIFLSFDSKSLLKSDYFAQALTSSSHWLNILIPRRTQVQNFEIGRKNSKSRKTFLNHSSFDKKASFLLQFQGRSYLTRDHFTSIVNSTVWERRGNFCSNLRKYLSIQSSWPN